MRSDAKRPGKGVCEGFKGQGMGAHQCGEVAFQAGHSGRGVFGNRLKVPPFAGVAAGRQKKGGDDDVTRRKPVFAHEVGEERPVEVVFRAVG